MTISLIEGTNSSTSNYFTGEATLNYFLFLCNSNNSSLFPKYFSICRGNKRLHYFYYFTKEPIFYESLRQHFPSSQGDSRSYFLRAVSTSFWIAITFSFEEEKTFLASFPSSPLLHTLLQLFLQLHFLLLLENRWALMLQMEQSIQLPSLLSQ